ncbi:MAG: DUF4234 domain-containing protein [Clostridia bacterium]|nr:DUF4234 domain-containing protein [Clostridia bacterium]
MEQTVNIPVRQLRTNRSLIKYILLSIITLGIYELVMMSHISEEINLVASPHDGKKTMHFCLLFFIFSWLTLGIAPFVWFHRISARMGNELTRRGISYSFGAADFWLWNILGAIIIVGPFVYIHKFLKAQNLINADYNQKG